MNKRIMTFAIAMVVLVIAIVSLGVAFIVLSQSHSTISPSPKVTPTPTPTLTPTPTTTATTPEPNNSNSTPSVPTFTVTLTNASYYVPTTYYTDPQTGANITKASYFVNAENLTFTIQNQPNVTFYDIRWTTPYMTNWDYVTGSYEGNYMNPVEAVMNATVESSSGLNTTWVATGTYGEFSLSYENVYGYSFPSFSFESGATIDFQVQALNASPQFELPSYFNGDNEQYSIIGEPSSWSQTQTITIP